MLLLWENHNILGRVTGRGFFCVNLNPCASHLQMNSPK